MKILKNNQRSEIRFDQGDLKIFEPSEIQMEDIMEMLKNQNINIENNQLNGEVDLSFIRYILRECTSIGNEVDDYTDNELAALLENGNRKMKLFIREVEALINELVEDLFYAQEKELKLIVSLLNILNSNTDKLELESKFNKLMKKNKVNLTLEQMMLNKDNPEELRKIIKTSKKNNVKKKK